MSAHAMNAQAELALRSGLCAAGGVLVPPAPARILLDDTGLDVLPGFIDIHGDAFERALAPRPGVALPIGIALAELEAQLLAAGITTAFLAVTLSWEAGLRSAATYQALREALRARPPGAVPALYLHVRFEARNLAALDMLLADIAAGQVRMLSFNDHTPSMLRKLAEPVQAAKFAERAGQSLAQFAADASRAGQVSEAEIARAHRLLGEAARRAGIPIAAHDETSLEERAYFRGLGARISEFPTTVEVARDAVSHGETTVMGAPNVVRGGSHTGWHGAEALVQAGLCGVLCSDYHFPSLLQAVYRLARNGSADFAGAVALVTANAAAAAGLDDRGSLRPGQRADFLLVEPAAQPRLAAVIAAGNIAYLAPGAAARLSLYNCMA